MIKSSWSRMLLDAATFFLGTGTLQFLQILQTAMTVADAYSFKSFLALLTNTWMKVCKHSALWLYSGLWVSVIFSYTHGTPDRSAWLLCPIGVSRPYSSSDWFEFCFTHTHHYHQQKLCSLTGLSPNCHLEYWYFKKKGSGYGISVCGEKGRGGVYYCNALALKAKTSTKSLSESKKGPASFPNVNGILHAEMLEKMFANTEWKLAKICHFFLYQEYNGKPVDWELMYVRQFGKTWHMLL